ncbi:exodeoxyribonuclease VII small subunit [Adlercreutzia mucosicola]|jgi:exodeoxyribonuclease VII small subunit|uniref:Exodeoxyribonuclease 7 small subunit n=1 Tax=Adlercreutzia mucosicola TaxID=580026 RepID=A0A6N8JJE7_9ACTN|nr:exodeoxyribonuclease VII small subunit [Adlercreutzia mucosicola]MCI9494174.1 exodeoxyribonuclease VII small subunit [Adlercreutzia mucosicola]MEB1813850.1 exodeoxyribonuclease VII small subunit [Adlercreutzia mucosicola]MVX59993.1 exodeoxyribonuclease VII small subunit [Adlercreutzia mucosicola]
MEETIETTEDTLAPVDELTFRQALAELESIVAVLESNTLELEDSLASYERGVVLLGSLQKRLAAAEQQVEVLMGELAAAPDDETRDTTLS